MKESHEESDKIFEEHIKDKNIIINKKAYTYTDLYKKIRGNEAKLDENLYLIKIGDNYMVKHVENKEQFFFCLNLFQFQLIGIKNGKKYIDTKICSSYEIINLLKKYELERCCIII